MGQPDPGASRARPHARRRGDDGSARSGNLERGRSRHRRSASVRPLRPPGPRDRRPSHLRDCQRRRLDGGRRVGSMLARRPPRARKTDRSLRPESHLALWLDVALLHRGRRRPVPGIRLARAARHRRQRPGRHRHGDRGGTRRAHAAVHHPGPHRDRLRRASQAEHVRGARVAARPRRAARREGQSRLAARAGVPGAPGGRGALPDRGGPRAGARARLGRAAARVSRGASRPGRRAHETPRGRAAGRVGRRSSRLRGRRQGHRDPQGVGERDAGDGRPAPGARRRLGGPESLDLHLAQEGRRLRGRHREPGRRAGAGGWSLGTDRAQPPLRRTRARNGLGGERPRAARRLRSVRLHLPRLLRLHAPGDPALGAGTPGNDLGLHARQHRAGRGRPHAPAGRALRRSARDSRPALHPARRRQRDGVGVAPRPRAAPSSDRARPHPPERPHPGSDALRLGRGHAPRGVRPQPRRRAIPRWR